MGLANNLYEQYKIVGVQTSTPEKLIIECFEGVIKFLNLARKELKEKKVYSDGTTYFEHFTKNLMKAEKILVELSASLNFEKGGEIAKNLYAIYFFLLEQLHLANLEKDEEKIILVQKYVTILKDAFEEAIKKNKVENSLNK
jgi:flagellar protein FliS